jgi:hypothetical protein
LFCHCYDCARWQICVVEFLQYCVVILSCVRSNYKPVSLQEAAVPQVAGGGGGGGGSGSSSSSTPSPNIPLLFFQNSGDAKRDSSKFFQCFRLFPRPPKLSTPKKNRSTYTHCVRIDFDASSCCVLHEGMFVPVASCSPSLLTAGAEVIILISFVAFPDYTHTPPPPPPSHTLTSAAERLNPQASHVLQLQH